jgi:hypothetical protein
MEWSENKVYEHEVGLISPDFKIPYSSLKAEYFFLMIFSPSDDIRFAHFGHFGIFCIVGSLY